MKKRILSLLLVLCLMISLLPTAGLSVQAAESATDETIEDTTEETTEDTTEENVTWGYITLSADVPFMLEATKKWDGKLYYATDAKTWTEWTGSEIMSSKEGFLYLRGEGNTIISGGAEGKWCFSMTANDGRLVCTGNIMTLLDSEKPDTAQMGKSCFESLFADCAYLTAAPMLPATKLAENCYCRMFQNCRSLLCAPELPETDLVKGCYQEMFAGCRGLYIMTTASATAVRLTIPENAKDSVTDIFKGTAKETLESVATVDDTPETGVYYIQATFPIRLTQKNGVSGTFSSLEAALNNVKSDATLQLLADVTMNDNLILTLSYSLTLDLNGHVLNLNMAHIENAGKLSIIDSNPDTIHRINTNHLWIPVSAYAEGDGIQSINGGLIISGVGMFGGAIWNQAGGVLKLSGGTIAGNEAVASLIGGDEEETESTEEATTDADYSGGAVYNEGAFYLYDGKLLSNMAEKHGGAVCNCGTFIMYGGQISGCTAKNGNGGAVVNMQSAFDALNTVSFILKNGTIANCSAQYGGGIAVTGGSIFRMKTGRVENCTATEAGGGIALLNTKKNAETMQNGTLYLENGSICDCSARKDDTTAAGKGGALFIEKGCTANVQNGTLKGCTAAEVGGAVYNAGTFEIKPGENESCTIQDNQAQKGAGIYNDMDALMTMQGTLLTGNIAQISGGGVQNADGATFRLLGATIEKNTATEGFGGGVFTEGILSLKGKVLIKDNLNGNLTLAGSAEKTTLAEKLAAESTIGLSAVEKEEAGYVPAAKELIVNYAAIYGEELDKLFFEDTEGKLINYTIVLQEGKLQTVKCDAIEIAATAVPYTGKEVTPEVEVIYHGKKLTKDTDYTISCTDNVEFGQGKVTVTLKGDYEGEKTVSFDITAGIAELSGVTVADKICDDQPVTCYGTPVATFGEMKVELKEYSYQWYNAVGDVLLEKAPSAVGSYYLIVSGKSEKFYGTQKLNCLIKPAILGETQITYRQEKSVDLVIATNAESKNNIGVIVSGKDYEKTLKADEDYTITGDMLTVTIKKDYMNSLKSGEYTFSILSGIFADDEAERTTEKALVSFTTALSVNVIEADGSKDTEGSRIYVLTAWNGEASASEEKACSGQVITLNIQPKYGCVMEKLSAMDANGQTVNITQDEKGVYSFVMPSSAVTVSVEFSCFLDVSLDDYFHDSVMWAVDKKITSGMDALHFAPDKTTTRAQMVTFLWRASGSPEPKTTDCSFTDVDKTQYYYKAVLWAVENGITKGISETVFGVDKPVTRAQAVTFLARLEGITDDATGYEHSFKDVPRDAYYYNAVAWASKNKITTGKSATEFAPDAYCKRGEVVTFLWRCFVK